MPTYEYACQSCGHRFEIFQSIKAERLSDCPSCKESGLQRIVGSGAGIIFKGSGFYQTDYRKESGGEKTSGEKTSEGNDAGAKAKPETDKTKKEPAASAKDGNGKSSGPAKD